MSIKLQVYLKFLIISTILSLNQILIDTVKPNLLGPDLFVWNRQVIRLYSLINKDFLFQNSVLCRVRFRQVIFAQHSPGC